MAHNCPWTQTIIELRVDQKWTFSIIPSKYFSLPFIDLFKQSTSLLSIFHSSIGSFVYNQILRMDKILFSDCYKDGVVVHFSVDSEVFEDIVGLA